MFLETTSERVARNQSTFRAANEKIEDAAQVMFDGEQPGRLPFICECPDRGCTAIALLTFEEYETVRSRGDTFFVVPGDEVCEVDGERVAEVVDRSDRFTVMAKVGHAAAVAVELDPRATDG
jgi:hypothetical protein